MCTHVRTKIYDKENEKQDMRKWLGGSLSSLQMW